MQRKPTGALVLDFDTMTQALAEIETRIKQIESEDDAPDRNAEYDDLCRRRSDLKVRMGEMFAEKRSFRNREKSLTRKRGGRGR